VRDDAERHDRDEESDAGGGASLSIDTLASADIAPALSFAGISCGARNLALSEFPDQDKRRDRNEDHGGREGQLMADTGRRSRRGVLGPEQPRSRQSNRRTPAARPDRIPSAPAADGEAQPAPAGVEAQAGN